MEISERAKLTYEAIQRRKKDRERQYRQDISAVNERSYLRNYKRAYGSFYALGHKK